MRLLSIASIALLTIGFVSGCAGRQETAETTTETPAAQAVPTCGDWIVVVEKPTATGKYDANRLRTAMLEGFGDESCKAFTSLPAAAPADAKVLKVTAKASAIGDAGAISLMGVDAAGNVAFRLQEKIAAGQDGTAAARTLGAKAARKAGAGA